MGVLAGKVALATGAGGEQGLGRAIALRLAEVGADVAAISELVGKPREAAVWAARPRAWPGAERVERVGRPPVCISTARCILTILTNVLWTFN